MIRSALLLLACLPVLVLWRGSLRRLWLVLGWALFVLVGFAAMIQAYWLPLGLRAVHSLEMLADALAYAAILVILFARTATKHAPLGLKQQERAAGVAP